MKFKLKNMKKKLLTLLALTTLLLVSCESVEKVEDVSSSTTVTINLPKGEKFIDLKARAIMKSEFIERIINYD